eukprot:483559_1
MNNEHGSYKQLDRIESPKTNIDDYVVYGFLHNLQSEISLEIPSEIIYVISKYYICDHDTNESINEKIIAATSYIDKQFTYISNDIPQSSTMHNQTFDEFLNKTNLTLLWLACGFIFLAVSIPAISFFGGGNKDFVTILFYVVLGLTIIILIFWEIADYKNKKKRIIYRPLSNNNDIIFTLNNIFNIDPFITFINNTRSQNKKLKLLNCETIIEPAADIYHE